METIKKTAYNFSPLAAGYDDWYKTPAGRRHDRAQKAAVAALLPPVKAGRHLLDAGCGTGHWSIFFAQRGYEVLGIDRSPNMIAVARAQRSPPCRFEVADIFNLPFPRAQFDVVSAITVLEFTFDGERACKALWRCLNSGGTLLIGTLNRTAALNRKRLAMGTGPFSTARLYARHELLCMLAQFGRTTIHETRESRCGGALLVAKVMKS